MKTSGKKKAKIKINRELCKGCKICIAFCPHDVLELNNAEKAFVARIEGCNSCGMCELRCPDIAIEVKKLKA